MINMCNHLLYFSIAIHFHLASFYAINSFEKQLSVGKCSMLIEQIIEFELRGRGPSGLHVLL